MKRFASSVLLLVLVMPYARMPACAAAGHEHAGREHGGQERVGYRHAAGDHVPPHAVQPGVSHGGHDPEGDTEGDDAPRGCHHLMACGTTLQGVPGTDAPASLSAPLVPAVRPLAPAPRDGPAREPLSPPPRSA